MRGTNHGSDVLGRRLIRAHRKNIGSCSEDVFEEDGRADICSTKILRKESQIYRGL